MIHPPLLVSPQAFIRIHKMDEVQAAHLRVVRLRLKGLALFTKDRHIFVYTSSNFMANLLTLIGELPPFTLKGLTSTYLVSRPWCKRSLLGKTFDYSTLNLAR